MRSALTVVAAAAISVAAGGCHHAATPAPDASTSAVGITTGSPADVTFLENMVVHHQQALNLLALVPARSTNRALVSFAERNAAQQQTELQGCQAQLLQWDVPGGRSASDPTADIPGMVDKATVDKLHDLHGPAFDTLWLQSMITHHRGAITMAQNEIQNGESPEAISIAQSLVPFQQSQITQMNQLLGAS